MNLNNINTLVLSGGGINGIAFIGSLKYLFEKININQINNYIGTSIGAGICYSLILKYTIQDITKIFLEYDFNKFIPNIKIDELIFNYGVTNGNALNNFLIELSEFKNININITFQDFFKLNNIKFTIVVSNITSNHVEYWNYLTTPNYKILDALFITCNYPFYIKPYYFNSNYFLDGGLMNNYPINYIDIDNLDSVIGIYINNKKDDFNNLLQSHDNYINFFKYLYNIFDIILESRINLLNQKYLDRTIFLNTRLLNSLDFTANNDIKIKMINMAYEQTEYFFNNI
jgi:predicted acylesterase/phospholipase RssA